MSILAYAAVGAGSALGGMLRYSCYGLFEAHSTFPWGTLFVNLLGSLFIGFFAGISGPGGRILVSPLVRQFVMPGLCGGFTTFSTFSLETLNLTRDGEWARAAANVMLNLSLCLLGVWLGHLLATALNER